MRFPLPTVRFQSSEPSPLLTAMSSSSSGSEDEAPPARPSNRRSRPRPAPTGARTAPPGSRAPAATASPTAVAPQRAEALLGRCHEHDILPNRRGRGTPAGQLSLPQHVLFVRPFDGKTGTPTGCLPLNSGPRHCGQLESAAHSSGIATSRLILRIRGFMAGLPVGTEDSAPAGTPAGPASQGEHRFRRVTRSASGPNRSGVGGSDPSLR